VWKDRAMRRFTRAQRDDDIEAQMRIWEMKGNRISAKKLRLDMDICFNLINRSLLPTPFE
jgi:hypothetical protein